MSVQSDHDVDRPVGLVTGAASGMGRGVAVTYGAAVTDWIKSTSEASADIVAAARRELARR